MARRTIRNDLTTFLIRHWDAVRRLSTVATVALFLLALPTGYFLYVAWKENQRLPVLTSDDEFDRESDRYWFDRASETIKRAESLPFSHDRRFRTIKQGLSQLQRNASKIPGAYLRSRALTDIALAQLALDHDLTVRDILPLLSGTPSLEAMKTRVIAAIAMMESRQNHSGAALVAIDDYNRIVYDNDLKLDNEDGLIAYAGVVRVLCHLNQRSRLTRLFEATASANDRIPDTAVRGLASRFLAGRQAWAGFKWESLETAGRISLPVEQSRAFQLIIATIARPEPLELIEPTLVALPTTGPWPPVGNVAETRQCIKDVFEQLARNPDATEQATVLLYLAGSRLLCDAEIHPLFLKGLEESELFEPGIKGAAIALINNPRSNLIRAARGLAILPERLDIVDTANDNWGFGEEIIRVAIEPIDAETVRGVGEQRMIRTLLSMAQSLLECGNKAGARRTLHEAAAPAGRQANLFNRVDNLLRVGSLQITAADPEAAKSTLRAARESYLEFVREKSQTRVTITESTPVEIGMAQIRARFLDDAVETVHLIPASRQKNDLLVLLIRELFRTGETAGIEELLDQMQDDPRKNDMLRRLGAGEPVPQANAETSTETNTAANHVEEDRPDDSANETAATGTTVNVAVNTVVNTTANTVVDAATEAAAVFAADPANTAEQRIRGEEFEAAVELLERIEDRAVADRLRMRIVRAYVAIGRPYVGTDAYQRRVRARMLQEGFQLATSQQTPLGRVLALESLATGFASGPLSQQNRSALREVIRETDKSIRSLPEDTFSEYGTKLPEWYARLAKARLLLVVTEERLSHAWPVLSADKNKSTLRETSALLEKALESLVDETPLVLRATTTADVAGIFGLLGERARAETLAATIPAMIREMRDARRRIPLYVQLAGIYSRLGNPSHASELLFEASAVSEQVDSGVELMPEQWGVLGRRVREASVETIVRGQLKLGLHEDAIRTIPQITEEMVRDRLYRMIVYQFLYEDRFDEAETIARKIATMAQRSECLQNVVFLRESGRERGRGEK
ncbi:MAG TPA: hypothetical protein DEB39_16020 [Planctomycetaceae bacterium]|nr:hypothetical protein [Planctomycetaceae bacterium]